MMTPHRRLRVLTIRGSSSRMAFLAFLRLAGSAEQDDWGEKKNQNITGKIIPGAQEPKICRGHIKISSTQMEVNEFVKDRGLMFASFMEKDLKFTLQASNTEKLSSILPL